MRTACNDGFVSPVATWLLRMRVYRLTCRLVIDANDPLVGLASFH
jgi:hypothetical protein